MLAAKLLATHSYTPSSCSVTSTIVKLPTSWSVRVDGGKSPNTCTIEKRWKPARVANEFVPTYAVLAAKNSSQYKTFTKWTQNELAAGAPPRLCWGSLWRSVGASAGFGEGEEDRRKRRQQMGRGWKRKKESVEEGKRRSAQSFVINRRMLYNILYLVCFVWVKTKHSGRHGRIVLSWLNQNSLKTVQCADSLRSRIR